MSDTGYLSPATTGTPLNQFTNGANVKTSNNVYATERTNTQKLDTSDYSISIPAGNSIIGILVEVEAKGALHTSPLPESDSGDLNVDLSYNGGTNYTAIKTNNINTSFGEQYWTFGGATDLWGRSWTDTELNNTNFRARMSLTNAGTHFELQVDHIRVKIFYSSGQVFTLLLTGAGT